MGNDTWGASHPLHPMTRQTDRQTRLKHYPPIYDVHFGKAMVNNEKLQKIIMMNLTLGIFLRHHPFEISVDI